MRLLFINHRDIYHPQAGGAERVILEVARRLAKRGIDVSWLSESVNTSRDYEDGVKLLHAGHRFSLHLYSLLQAGKYDVVIDSVAHAVPFFSYLVNRRSIALVHHVHQEVVKYELDPVTATLVRQLEKGVKNYPWIISISHTTKRDLVSLGVDPRKITVIHNGIDHSLYQPGEKSPTPMILWIGRMKNYKNPLDPIKVFKRLKTRATLVIVGSGDLEEEVKRATLGERDIIYLGRVSEAKKVELYQRAWVTLSTSFIEGWGMTVVEANACGTPVLGYATGSLPEIVEEGVNGFLVGYKDLDGMAQRLEYMLNEDVMKSLSKSSYVSSLKYDWDKTADQYYAKVKEVLQT